MENNLLGLWDQTAVDSRSTFFTLAEFIVFLLAAPVFQRLIKSCPPNYCLCELQLSRNIPLSRLRCHTWKFRARTSKSANLLIKSSCSPEGPRHKIQTRSLWVHWRCLDELWIFPQRQTDPVHFGDGFKGVSLWTLVTKKVYNLFNVITKICYYILMDLYLKLKVKIIKWV